MPPLPPPVPLGPVPTAPEGVGARASLAEIGAAEVAEVADRAERAERAERADDAARSERERALVARITDATPDLVYVYDVATGGNVYANRRLGDLLGYAPAEIAALGDRLFATLVHADDLPRVLERLARYQAGTVADGVVLETEYRMRHADGGWRWLRGRDLVFSRDADGRVREVLGVAQDVTERVEAERARERGLAEATAARGAAERAADRMARLQRVTAALARLLTPEQATALVVAEGCAAVGTPHGAVGLLVDDADGRRAFALASTRGRDDAPDTAWRRFPADLPVPFAEVVRTRAPIVVASAEEYARRFPRLAEQVARCGVTGGIVVPLETEGRVHGAMGFDFTDGRARDADDVAYLLTLGQQCAQALERARLLAAERDARADAEAARVEAERASRAKSEFLAVMSHELRTPLNAIGGHAQLVALGIHGPVTEAQHAALARVERAQRHLLGLIDTILNFARVEAGRLEYHLRETDLAELLAEVAPLLEPQMQAGGLSFAVRRPTPSGLRAWADREKLEQVLLNLLSNAAKFTAAGGRVTVRAEPVPDRPDLVRVVVADTGIGISADKLEAIFEPFVQIRTGTPHPPVGTGLGLAISRDLARGMGGDVTVESRPGKGSRFAVLLRRA